MLLVVRDSLDQLDQMVNRDSVDHQDPVTCNHHHALDHLDFPDIRELRVHRVTGVTEVI